MMEGVTDSEETGGREKVDSAGKAIESNCQQPSTSPAKHNQSSVKTFHTDAAVITMNYGNESHSDEESDDENEDAECEEGARQEQDNEDVQQQGNDRGKDDDNDSGTDGISEKNDGIENRRTSYKPRENDYEKSTENGRIERDCVETMDGDTTLETMDEDTSPQLDREKNGESYANRLAKMRSERFNPFNKVPFLDESHFDGCPASSSPSSVRSRSSSAGKVSFLESGIVLDNDGDPGHSSKSSDTSDTMTESSLPSSFTEFEGELITAELGLTEDHFSHPEGYFGFTMVEELQLAIENCKEMVMEASEHSEKRKELIKKLVQLRMKLQELKEGPEEEEENTKITLGHKFKKKTSKSSKHHCEKCAGLIWGMIQTWYKCKGCGYTCHSKCLPSITRSCISSKLATATFTMNICPESGLAAQSFRCAECKNHMVTKGASAETRLCDYNGLYYCEECHWNDSEIMPARVVHNWDFDARKVSRSSRQFLRLMGQRAVIKIQDVNPMLFNYVEELSQVGKLREDILMMKAYFLSCKNALENRVLLMLKERQHFVDNSDMYSLQDLKDTYDGVLLPELLEVHTHYAKHIKEDCKLCQAKGFICELCTTDEIIYPFDVLASICPNCNAVYHRVCYSRNNGECPKCQRFAERNIED